MAVINPLKVLLFTNQPEAVNRIHQTVSANPSAPLWWTLVFAPILAFSAFPLTLLIHPTTQVVFGWNYLVTASMLFVMQALGILFMNGMATWAINRQQRKSWGVPLPDEPRVLGFRPGIWVGAATSCVVCLIMLILEASVILLHTMFHQQIVSTMSTVVSVMSLLYFSYAISYFYGMPKRLFVFRYVVLPLVLISTVGIIAAIVMGQARNYENQKARHDAYHSAAPATMIAPARLPAPSPVAPPSAIGVYAARPSHTTGQALLAPPSRFGGSSLLLSMIRKDDAHCLAGLPLDAPWLAATPVSATVVRFVPRMEVLRDIAWNNRALHGMIAPRYLRNQRVLLHPDGSPAGVTMLALVPVGMRVTIGEDVRMTAFHAFHRAPCTYVPNLVER